MSNSFRRRPFGTFESYCVGDRRLKPPATRLSPFGTTFLFSVFAVSEGF